MSTDPSQRKLRRESPFPFEREGRAGAGEGADAWDVSGGGATADDAIRSCAPEERSCFLRTRLLSIIYNVGAAQHARG
jgi:hypothetical protein